MDQGKVERLINLERYPIADAQAPGFQDVVESVRADLAGDGCGCLPGFLSEEGLEMLADEARKLAPLSYGGPTEASPYFFNYQTDKLADLPDDHPLRHKGERKLAQVAGDLIPVDAALRALHQSDLMARFLAAVAGVPRMHPGADKHQSLNISVMQPGGCQQWHFDRGNLTTTLMLQPPEGGGAFQYAPNLRSDEDENFAAVREILDGDESRCRTVSMDAGTLMLFRGHYALHRVTRVEGNRTRLLAILSYNPEPGIVGSLESSILHYGRRVAEGAE